MDKPKGADWMITQGDCLEVLASRSDNIFHSTVTDPPYGLSFMGAGWDHGVPGAPYWTEILRVMRPGAFLLAFGGTRTYHRLAVAIEDAGFEIRDSIVWMYGSGFPKSQNIGKAIDKKAGAVREVVGFNPIAARKANKQFSSEFKRRYENSPAAKDNGATITAPATPEAQQWDGWGTALKPAHENICVARKPLSESTVAGNVLKHGTGGINIDASRISGKPWTRSTEHRQDNRGGKFHAQAGDQQIKIDPQEMPSNGRWPANVILSHHDDCTQFGTKTVKGSPSSKTPHGAYGDGPKATGMLRGNSHSGNQHGDTKGNETVQNWDCHPDCPVRLLDAQSGMGKSRTGGKFKAKGLFPIESDPVSYADSGGASRFFYVAKAGRSERYFYCSDCDVVSNRCKEHAEHTLTFHPTQKPVELIRYLQRLVTPPGGITLDPFMGSGTAGVAAELEGFEFLGIDKEPVYCRIARERIDLAARQEKLALNF